RNGRKYYNDDYTPYCLPCDVKELSRQTLWHELSRVLWGGFSSIDFSVEKIPDSVLELGCGSAIWSACMADEFAKMGRSDVKFTGMDVVDVRMDMKGVDFKFVKHNLLTNPFPFEDNAFDFVFCRDMTLCYPSKKMYIDIISEILRIVKPGGLLEIQCSDYTIRTLQRSSASYAPGIGAYEITSTTQFNSNSENTFIQQWNDRITKALVKRDLPPVPCTLVGASFLGEEGMTEVHSKRLALPFDTVWWESPNADSTSESSSSMCSNRRSTSGSSMESFSSTSKQFPRKRGGSISASSYHHHHFSSNKGSSTSGDCGLYPSPLTDEERAIRHLAKLTFAQLIEALEPILREADDKNLDEWDGWYRDMMRSWFEGNGLRNGECMEFGAWTGRKK
ncbi:hypothetical protein K440DRAFT_487066, partial [Wilcoxina mikolae CBS 423.85]